MKALAWHTEGRENTVFWENRLLSKNSSKQIQSHWTQTHKDRRRWTSYSGHTVGRSLWGGVPAPTMQLFSLHVNAESCMRSLKRAVMYLLLLSAALFCCLWATNSHSLHVGWHHSALWYASCVRRWQPASLCADLRGINRRRTSKLGWILWAEAHIHLTQLENSMHFVIVD